jgi:putative transcriptional regulator
MVRLNLTPLLKAHGWTPYRLAKEADLSLSTVYRLMNEKLGRFDAVTIDKLCRALDAEPGDLFVRTRGKR